MEENVHKQHRSRVKEKMLKTGLDNWASHEVLELLLFHAIPQGDTNPTAHRLLERFGSVSGILNASVEELCTVKGMGVHSARLIKTTAELTKRYYQDDYYQSKSIVLDNVRKLGRYCTTLFIGKHYEEIYVLLLDHNARLLGTELIARGSLDEISLDFRMLMEQILKYHATEIVLTHNHPNAPLRPSENDISVTLLTQALLRQTKVVMLDHVIVSGVASYSMRETGHLSD